MRRCIAVVTLLLAAGCSGGLRSNAPASQTYTLRAAHAPQTPPAAKAADASLRVELPLTGPGLHSEHIVIVQPDHRMSYYAGSEWAAQLPLLVEELSVERLRATGDWVAVNGSESAFSSEYFLQITIRRFEAEYTTAAAPTARVAFDCAIGRRADRVLLASFTAQAAASASANRVGAVVAAFEEAANAALNDLAAGSIAAVKSSQVPSNP
jgi:cholesterol transport system auxiliary component